MKLSSPVLNSDVQLFLDTLYERSKVELVTSAKEQEELFKVAARKGIIAKGSKDLGLFKNIYAFTGEANRNGDRLPESIFIKALPTIVMKPVNYNHQRQRIIGVYFDYVYQAKERRAITYGIFYKDIFPKLWQEYIKYMKKGKLKSSFEIWCPDSAKQLLPDGTKNLLKMEMAGGALLIDDPENYPDQEPAFDGCDVLAIAKNTFLTPEEQDKQLVYASYSAKDIIMSSAVESVPTLKPADSPAPAPTNVLPTVHPKNIRWSVKCMVCAMPLETGVIESESEKEVVVKCATCGVRHQLKLATIIQNPLKQIPFVFFAAVNCPQCGRRYEYHYFSQHDSGEKKLECPQCQLSFSVVNPTDHNRLAIKEIIELEPKKEKIIDDEEDRMNIALNYKALRDAAHKIKTLKSGLILASTMQKEKDSDLVKSAAIKRAIARKAIGRYLTVSQKLKDFTAKTEETLADAEARVAMYKANAVTLQERKQLLGDEFIEVEQLMDEQLLDDKDFQIAKLKKELQDRKPEVVEPEVPVSIVLSTKTAKLSTNGVNGYYTNSQIRKEIDKKTGFSK